MNNIIYKGLFIAFFVSFNIFCLNISYADIGKDIALPLLDNLVKQIPKQTYKSRPRTRAVPRPKYYGKTYTSISSYRYIIFESGIKSSYLRVLEQVLSQKGYYVLGKNSLYRSKGTLFIECRINDEYKPDYSTEFNKIYRYLAVCELKDVNRNNFIVYSGQSEVYGSGENAKSQSLSLTLVQLNSSAQLHDAIHFDVKGVDNGRRSTIQKDRDEAILDAKYQALAKLGSEMTSLEKYRLELSQGKISEDTYRQEIEARASGRILPDCDIEELGYINGSYTVRYIGSVVPDPIGSIETNSLSIAPNKTYQYNNTSTLDQSIDFPEILLALERTPTGALVSWLANGKKYNMQIIEEYYENQRTPCKKYTLHIDGQQSVNIYEACRESGQWKNR